MANSRIAVVHGLWNCLLPLYIARGLIEAYQPFIFLLCTVTNTVTTWSALVETLVVAFWYDHLFEAPIFFQSKACSIAKEEIFQPLGFQPKDGFCRRFSGSMMWVTGVLLGGCLLRYLWLLTMWSRLRKESGEFWHALFNDGMCFEASQFFPPQY